MSADVMEQLEKLVAGSTHMLIVTHRPPENTEMWLMGPSGGVLTADYAKGRKKFLRSAMVLLMDARRKENEASG